MVATLLEQELQAQQGAHPLAQGLLENDGVGELGHAEATENQFAFWTMRVLAPTAFFAGGPTAGGSPRQFQITLVQRPHLGV